MNRVESTSRLTRQPVFELCRWSHVHSALAMTVEEGGVGAMAQQQGAHLHPVLGRSLVQRRELPEVHGVHTGAVLQSEKLQLYAIFSEDCYNSLQTKSGFSSQTTTYFEQKLCDLKVAVGTSVMERNEAAAEPEIRSKGQIQAPVFLS